MRWVAVALADREHVLGIVPTGTYNNFASPLGIPTSVDAAIRLIKRGRPYPITLGRVGDEVFLEACAVGVFGEAILLGEAAKDARFGEFGDRLRSLAGTRPFEFKLSGDLEGDGVALSLVVANTPTTGARLAVGTKTPVQPFLELAISVVETRSDLISRFLASSLLRRPAGDSGVRFRFRELRVETRPRMRTIADNVTAGRTPATVRADAGALRVIRTASPLGGHGTTSAPRPRAPGRPG